MTLLFAIEASQSDGTVYRMLLGLKFPPLASWLAVLGRLY
jgi:hypothetical protein